jgi:N-acetylglutamate synthase and related acetyltransferases
MNLVIEKACVDDALKLVEARNKSFYDDFVKFGECPGYNNSVDDMKQRIQDSLLYKILADGEIIGDASIQQREDGFYWIGCLEIIPEYQNKGVGSRVLSYIQGRFPEAKRWGLDTPVQDIRNCCFYEKMGFVKVDEKIRSEKLTLRTYEKVVKDAV